MRIRLLLFWLSGLALVFRTTDLDAATIIGNFQYTAPAGIAFVKDDVAAFMMDPGWHSNPGLAAPNDSIHKTSFKGMEMDWGRVGDGIAGRLTSDQPQRVVLKLQSGWPGFKSQFTAETGGVKGEAVMTNGTIISWRLQVSPAPVSIDSTQITVAVAPDAPVHFTAGFGTLPAFDRIDNRLDRAEQTYEARRPKAAGPAGDFLGAIADNLNNSRLYSNDNKMLAISVSRFWTRGINKNPYFCWDSFFNGLLASLDDPQMGRQTIRAILSCQTPEGMVPNFGHWVNGQGPMGISADRSQPPVGSLCVWKMHLINPDIEFLREVYPELARWHSWWMTARDARHDGLLEWGTATKHMTQAKYETGWDDSPEFEGATMTGTTMNAYAVDLNSLWAMDAHYLALIAEAIGQRDDVKKYEQQEKEMNQRINDKLWNEKLGIYCSRRWDNEGKPGAFLTRLTPMNFYPLICGAPSPKQARRMLAVMTDTNQFWGDWILPTVSRNDPLFSQQNYWHGTIWGPVNYLVFQGVRRYAPRQVQADYAEKSVRLFMQNWVSNGVCGENFLSTTGRQSRDDHYTWGTLLCLVGFESIVHLDDNGVVHPGPGFNTDVDLTNVPWGSRLHHITVRHGKVTILEMR